MWPFRSALLSLYLRFRTGARHVPSSSASTLQLRVVTTAAVLTIMACAILTPDVRTPLSIVNSVSGSLIIFILPALFYLNSKKGPWFVRENIGAVALLVVGLVLAPFCLGLTIYELVKS